MRRALNQLTATEVKAAKGKYKKDKFVGDKTYTLSDGGGLNLSVRPNGGRSWQFRYINENGKPAIASFGTYPDVKLADARNLAEAARKDLSGPVRITPPMRAAGAGVRVRGPRLV